MSVASRTVDPSHFITDVGPDIGGGAVEFVDTIIHRHIDNPFAVSLVDDHVHISEIRATIAARHDRDTDHTIASLAALDGHGVKFGDRIGGKI
jgi:hypothetical protein